LYYQLVLHVMEIITARIDKETNEKNFLVSTGAM
jgi:hypothetical protein